MFEGKARNLTKSGAHGRCFTWAGFSLTREHQARLERLAREKRSSLLQKFVKYVFKKFYKIWPGDRTIKHLTLIIYTINKLGCFSL
jgi:hypothetical protein